MLTWPQLTLSVLLIILSVILTLFVLLHKGRGGGMGDLFGGGMSTAMGGTSVAERNLDRITVIITSLWVVCIAALLVLYRYFPEEVTEEPPAASTPVITIPSSDAPSTDDSATPTGDDTED
jgi:preprotein translocase subunit SecG